MDPYDHQTKAGNEGDVVKHPALIAALNGLLAEHEGLFRYADAFAGRWEYALREGGAWTSGIERFASCWAGGNPDVELWRRQWTHATSTLYPGSTQLAQRMLADRVDFEIRAFEIVEAYADSLRQKLDETAVFTRSATPADWSEWRPDLLFVDPPGLHSNRKPDYPTLCSLLQLARGIENVLMWLPMAGGRGSSESTVSPALSTRNIADECARRDFRALAVRWCDDGSMPGCLLVFRFASPKIIRRVSAAVADVIRTMGSDWRMVSLPTIE
jgi:23S rRNA A2030 N6-methylase RlmJ